MRIAVFDYQVTSNNPAGSCHLRMIEGLCDEHEFTVYARELESTLIGRVQWIRIPVPRRPLVLQFILFHLMAPFWYAWRRIVWGDEYDSVQFIESNLWFGDISYAHFCHREYLLRHWKSAKVTGLRGFFRYWDHKFHAWMEPLCFSRAKVIVTPSKGLARELYRCYPITHKKISVIPNVVDEDRMLAPPEFDRNSFRLLLGVSEVDTLLVFVALGQYERKGLSLLLSAMQLESTTVRLCVVGGENDLVRKWQRYVEKLGLQDRVTFTGMKRDIRPYLWSADAFILPSSYEVFPLVVLEAAAAGLPILATQLNGVEEFLQHARNGIVIERTVLGIANAIELFLIISAEERRRMGMRARAAIRKYSNTQFLEDWRELYSRIREIAPVEKARSATAF